MEINKISIPKGWRKVSIGECVVEKKKSPIKVDDAAYFGQYPFFTSGEAVLQHDCKLIDGENLYLATGGMANVKYFNGEAAYSTDTYVLGTKENICPKFMYYVLLFLKPYIDINYFQGSGLKHLQKKDFKHHEIFIPESKDEQQRIADALSKLDDSLSQTQSLIDKYELIKRGLMQDLLTFGIDKEGNVRSEKTHKFKDSPLGRIPEEWEWSTIGNECFVTKLAGFEFTKYIKYQDEGEIIAIRALNIKNEALQLKDVKYISKIVSDFLVRSKINKGDILITYIGAYIGDILQINENDKYHLAPNVAKIVHGNRITSDFLEIILRSDKVHNYFQSMITVTANPSLTMSQIRKSYIIFPSSKDEQIMIRQQIDKINNVILVNRNTYNSLQQQFMGLLSDLITGKVRI